MTAAASSWRASSLVVDGITLLAVVVCIPFAILAIGLPFALLVRLISWLVQLF